MLPWCLLTTLLCSHSHAVAVWRLRVTKPGTKSPSRLRDGPEALEPQTLHAPALAGPSLDLLALRNKAAEDKLRATTACVLICGLVGLCIVGVCAILRSRNLLDIEAMCDLFRDPGHGSKKKRGGSFDRSRFPSSPVNRDFDRKLGPRPTIGDLGQALAESGMPDRQIQFFTESPSPRRVDRSHRTEREWFEGVFDGLPDFVVASTVGWVLQIPASLGSVPQACTLDIRHVQRTALSKNNGLVMRAVASENGDIPGILVENPDGCPIAFLDTGEALAVNSAETRTNRHVVVRQPVGGGWENESGSYVIFFLNRTGSGCTLVGQPGSPTPGQPGRTWFTSAGAPVISAEVDEQGRLLKVLGKAGDTLGELVEHVDPKDRIDPSDVKARTSSYRLHINQGVDASLVVCAALAAQKLR